MLFLVLFSLFSCFHDSCVFVYFRCSREDFALAYLSSHGAQCVTFFIFSCTIKLTSLVVCAQSLHTKGASPSRILFLDPSFEIFACWRWSFCSYTECMQMVASAPCYPHGVIDPVEEMASVARRFKICLHVDCCLGGYVLPFARKLGCGQ